MLKKIIVPILLIFVLSVTAQTGTIKGRVFNAATNEVIPFASIAIDSLQIGTTSDIDGNYVLTLAPGIYNISCSFLGFDKALFLEVSVNTVKPTYLDFALQESANTLNEVSIVAFASRKTKESPVSRNVIGATEIYRSPGGNRDISKVIQILPGVASSASFRNDLIVRGGGPNENRFFLDDIEIPNINHFATQGSSGGPVGLLNVNFIEQVDFLAGAFPANRGNALSSVLNFKQITGNDEQLSGTFMVGSSDIGLTLDGPLGNNSTFILSVRRSYLKFLFKALSLPFLPTYTDFQYKHVFKINNSNELALIGIGAIDDFELNKSVNDNENDETTINRNNYLLNILPVNTQRNYAIGAKWTHFGKKSNQIFIASRNYLKNNAEKYVGNIEIPNNLLLDYSSEEIENKLRFESTKTSNGYRWNIGAGIQDVTYKNATFNKKEQNEQLVTISSNSELNFLKYELFTQLSKSVLNNKLALSFGIRTDFSNYSKEMNNPIDQLSPRFSASYTLSKKVSANFNLGTYYQQPAYTVMGYRDNFGALINKQNKITYIKANHIVGGFEFNPNPYLKITAESFYKTYFNYPFLLNEQISLANLGADFGVIGNDPVTSTSKGRAKGFEFLFRQRLLKTVYGIVSYTYVKSEFKDKNNVYKPSAWDNRHILNITAGKKFPKNWELGAKFRYLGGSPYTPYNKSLSAQKEIWDVSQGGILDWDKLNDKRNADIHTLDVRLDKKYYFKNWALDFYLDIQNIYNFQSKGLPYLDVVKDANGLPVENIQNPNSYQLYEIENTNGTILPSIGILIEF